MDRLHKLMKGLIQRVSNASVLVNGTLTGEIQQGIMLLLGVEKHDDSATADKLLHKVVNYRIFEDNEGKMNRSLLDVQGGLLIVSQFTLAAETRKGLRPSFSSAAPAEMGKALYEYFVDQAKNQVAQMGCGVFGADMKVSLTNDGPVTFLLET